MQNYTVRFANDPDLNIWNKYILSCSDYPSYLFYEMRALVESEYKVKTLLLIAEDTHQCVLGVLFAYHLERVGSILYTPTFGIISHVEEVIFQLIEKANQYSLSYGLSRMCYTTGFIALKSTVGFDRRWQKNTFIIDLNHSSELVWSTLSSSSRNKIRKAKSAGITIDKGIKYLDEFYSIYVDSYLRKCLNIKSYSFFKNSLEKLSQHMTLFVCLHNNRVVGGTIFLENLKISNYLYNASKFEYRSFGINDFLIWEAVKYYIEKGFSSINLGESKSGSGAYCFKAKQLKAKSRTVYYYSKNNFLVNRSSLEKIYEKLLIILGRKSFIPSFLMKKILMKRAQYGRFI